MIAKRFVVDACVALKWSLRDEGEVDQADVLLNDLIDGKIQLLAPTLLDYEITNALKMSVVRGRINELDAIQALKDYWAYSIERHDFSLIQLLTFQLSNKHQRSVYDATYMALAQSQGIELITGDKKLFNSVAASLTWVKWIGDYQ